MDWNRNLATATETHMAL